MLNDKPLTDKLSDILNPGEFFQFSIAQYKCAAQRFLEPMEDTVNITVTTNGMFFDRFNCPVSTTEGELRVLTARKIYGELNG